MSASRVWIVDDDASIRWVLERALGNAGLGVACFAGGVEVLDALAHDAPDALIADIRMPGISGLELLDRVRQRLPRLPVIVTTAHSDLEAAVASYRGGAFDYLPKPFDIDAAVAMARRAARSSDAAGPAPPSYPGASALVGEAPAMQELFRAIGRLAAAEIGVLIVGESGTGKELVARAVHDNSPRRAHAFIVVNTAAIPAELLESEFFGHEKGAFTGAVAQRLGRFEQAHGGTLFLDEIGDMPAALQTRLLRVLQDGTYYRVGGHETVTVDVRVVAATHQDLEAAVADGRFREDLYHRLNVIRLRVPPLRQRRADIPTLADLFLARAATELQAPAKRLDAPARAYLQTLAWPGNVRQLENTCRWLTVMAPGRDIGEADLPAELATLAPRSHGPGPASAADPDPDSAPALTLGSTPSAAAPPDTDATNADWQRLLSRWAQARFSSGAEHLLDEALPAFERVLIEAAMTAAGGQRQKAARLLGWGRNTLTRKLAGQTPRPAGRATRR